jgi:N-acetylneuraminic acid mutarotase
MSDTAAVTVGDRAYVIGGYTTTTPLRSVLEFRPGHAVRQVAVLPHPVRYAVAVAAGRKVLVAGGTDGTTARREVVSVDLAAHRARVIGHLPAPLAHAAGAMLRGTAYVLGGRGDATTSQRRTILAIDPATGRVRRAGHLPVALSDLSATSLRGRVMVVGGRDPAGKVHDEVWELAP